MKLLVVSHPCVTPINQELYAKVEELTGWKITLVGPSNWIDDYGTVRSLERWDAFSGEIVPVPVWVSGNIPVHVYRTSFVSILRSVEPDAVYIHNEPYAASTAQVLLARNLTQSTAAFGFYSAQNIVKSYPPPFRWTEQWVYRSSSFAFPCSETVLETLREKGYHGQATHLPLGIDPQLYRPVSKNEETRGAQTEQSILFGYVGRVTQEKGLATFFEALATLPNKLKWRLVIVGTGKQEEYLCRLSSALKIDDRIEWVGYVDHTEVPSYLSSFDVLVVPSETQPSWKEQFGRVIVEALACETPVVGTDSGEIPRLLERTQGGITVQERNANSLAEGLRTMALRPNLRRRYAQQGAEYVRENLSHRSLAEIFARSIRQAVSKPKAQSLRYRAHSEQNIQA